VEAEYNKERAVTEYNVTMDFLKYLGINSVSELPDFEKLNSDENLQKLLAQENTQVQDVNDEVVKVEVKEDASSTAAEFTAEQEVNNQKQ